jgi:energy-coupling factor transporter ATP-binding protein EcfA2
MTNNDIFKKLRVAHKLRDEDIIKILELVDFRVSKSELNALFQREDHPNYVECGDQILRNFLNGLIIHLRGPMPKKGEKVVKQRQEEKPLGSNAKNLYKNPSENLTKDGKPFKPEFKNYGKKK